ncbi:hypothetical protein F4781DRAFT_323458 [Annulohypoxylon bovei var. microspora]|nr:hypothetical protein F4781DRAFT_323458 [Annulohypoxylon bovei var. microspora]
MGPFALPVPSYRLGVHSRAGDKKSTGDGQENASPGPERDIPSHLPSDSINPLSHTPDTLRQFAVAGLSPIDEVPSKLHPLFPHKPLSSISKRQEVRSGSFIPTLSGAESEDDRGTARSQDKETTVKQLTERLRHISTMTAIMHRCLNDGDIARAKRAFGLLVQSKWVDIRLGGLWAVGSEILMRDGEAEEQQNRQQQPLQQQQATNEDGYEEARPSDETVASEREEPRRWGSAANVDKVRAYFENLIQQHPHDQHRPHLTSALDFWPALFGVEIYSLDAEFRRATHRLQASLENDNEDSFMEEDGFTDDPGAGMDVDMDEAFEARRGVGRRRMEWAARDSLRSETQAAAERIARQMDATMENAPYAAHRGLLRLRANLALFVGDLYLPSRLLDGDHAEEALRARAGSVEERGALDRREQEQDRSRAWFRKILDGGGELDEWALKFVSAGEDEEHDVTVEDGW